jgi:hypothetical protein
MKRLALLLLAACSGENGDISISLTTAPGSTVLDSVQTLRLTITNPMQVTTAERTASGFDIVLDLPADGGTGSVIVEGLDANGARIAVGQSPPFPFGAIDARIVVYMAAPNSVGPAPLMLTPARSDLGVGALGYGAIIAGGHDESGAATDDVAIYNAFDHTMLAGMALPAKRAGQTLAVGANGIVYMFGGLDETGQAVDSLWRFDTTTAPSGSYADFGDKPGFARADAVAAPLGNDMFLISGTPAAQLSGGNGSLTARTEVASLPDAGASVVATDGVATALFAGDTGIVRFRNAAFDTLDATPRPGASVTALPDGTLAVACGGPTLRVDATTGAITTFADHPETGCAVAATGRHLVIAGGTSPAGVTGSVEIDDVTTLQPIATASLAVPRTGATAIALPDDQVLIVGGTDINGKPIETLELFTPDAP